MGSTRMARRAGMKLAKSATAHEEEGDGREGDGVGAVDAEEHAAEDSA